MLDSKRYFYAYFTTLFNYIIFCLLLYSMPVISQTKDSKEAYLENEKILQAKNAELTNTLENFSNEFVFTYGDAIEIKVYPDTTTFPNGIYTIDGLGYAYLPILGYKKITDKTVGKLESLLKESYINYLPQPNIQVRPLVRVSLQGGFSRPGLYWIDPRKSMWSVVQHAGGTLREDGLEKMKWRRNRVTIARDLIPFIESGESLYSIGFKSGDQITVTQRPKQRFWDVFRTDVLPILSLTLSAAATISMTILAYDRYR